MVAFISIFMLSMSLAEVEYKADKENSCFTFTGMPFSGDQFSVSTDDYQQQRHVIH